MNKIRQKPKFKPEPHIKQNLHKTNVTKGSDNKYLYYVIPTLLLTIVVYWNSLFNGFILNWDDGGYIVKYPVIQNLNFDNIKIIFSTFYKGNYHPLTTFFYALEYKLVGESAFLFHLNNLIFHLINVYLTYILVQKLFKNNRISTIAAIIMGIHPMHVESVAWISERKDVLYTFFFLLSILWYIKFKQTNVKKWLYLGISSLFFFLSLLSKSAGVPLPIVLLLIDYLQERKFTKALIIEKIPHFILSFAFGIGAILSQKSAGAIQDLTPIYTLYERPLLAGYAMMLYIVKLFIPIELTAMYPYPDRLNGSLPMVYYIAPVFAVVILCAVAYSIKYTRKIAFGFLLFLIMIVLVLQLLPVGGAIAAERYTYVPYIGLSIIIGIGFENLYQKFALKSKSLKVLLVFVGITATLALSFLTMERVKTWKNGEILFTDVIEKYPNLPFAYNNRGYLYYAFLKQNDKALADYTTAIKMDTTHSDAYSNRGVLYYNTQKYDEAIKDFTNALKFKAKNKDALIGRANTYSTLKRYDDALNDYNNYLQHEPTDTNAYMWRGIAYFNLNKYNDALIDLDKATSMDPKKGEAFYWKGVVKYNQKEFKAAIEVLNYAEKLGYNASALYSWRGLAKYSEKNLPEAIIDYTKAIEKNPNDPTAWVNRSVSNYETNNFKQSFEDITHAAKMGYPIDRNYYYKVANAAGVKP